MLEHATNFGDRNAKRLANKVVSYKIDLVKAPQAKVRHHPPQREGSFTVFDEAANYRKNTHGITEVPCALIYKDGQLVKKVDGMKPKEMQEVGKMLAA
jgi:hypothetical protein